MTVKILITLSDDTYRALLPIANQRGTQVHVLIEDLVRRALRGPQKKRRVSKVTDAQREQIREWNTAGVSDSEIGRRLGIPQTTVYGTRKGMGLPPAVPQVGGRKKRTEVTS